MAKINLQAKDVWDFAIAHKDSLIDGTVYIIATDENDGVYILLEGFSDEEVMIDERVSKDGFGIYVEDLDAEIDWVFVPNRSVCERAVGDLYEKYLK